MCARGKGIRNFVEEDNLDYIYCYKKGTIKSRKMKMCVCVCRKGGGNGDLGDK